MEVYLRVRGRCPAAAAWDGTESRLGDSPGSSCELLGGWEESGGTNALGAERKEDSTTTLYGFPGLVFEVLKNGYVSAVTVY